MPKPTDEHRALERLVGTWSGEERLHPSPWDPQGGTAVGRVENRLALDGFAVLQHYEQERNGAVGFRGLGVFRFDSGTREYVFHWFDNMGTPPNEYRGGYDDGVWTLDSRNPAVSSRAVFDFREKNAYRFRMEVSQDGEQWNPFMEGTYRRKT